MQKLVTAVAFGAVLLQPCGAPAQVLDVAGGAQYTCAILTGGTVKCWGDFGRLNPDPLTPTDRAGVANAVRIAGGAAHACVLTAAGGVKCWGIGSLGNGALTDGLTAVEPQGLGSGVVAVGAGASYTCALMASGALKCWGANAYGQLGDGTTNAAELPRIVPGLESGVIAVAVGSAHACAVMVGGAVRCWGLNHRGQLGDGTTTNRSSPTVVSGLPGDVTALAAGAEQTCALTSGGAVWCWGVVDVGAGATTGASDVVRTRPGPVPELSSGVISITAGDYHTCALMASRAARCWGWNLQGQLGDGTTTNRYSPPRDVAGMSSGVAVIAAFSANTCAVSSSGLQCWGINDNAKIGNGARVMRTVPTAVFGLAPMASYEGLWWKSPAGSQSGWGVNVSHQGLIVFATWFTYDTDGSGLWMAATLTKVDEGKYSGPMYRTTGPAFDASPWDPARVSASSAGTATFTFDDENNGSFVSPLGSKTVTREVFSPPLASCALSASSRRSANYQGLWWNSSESGWGVNLTHQGDILFATWFTYDSKGKPMWLVMPRGERVDEQTFVGALYRTTGSSYLATWDETRFIATEVGSATFDFADVEHGTFIPTVNGVTQQKSIARQVFSTPQTVCQ